MSLLATALGFGKRAATDFSVSEAEMKGQQRKLKLTRATLEMKRSRFNEEWKRLTNLEANMKCSPFELSLNLRRAQNQSRLISHLDNYIRFYVRVESVYEKIIRTRHHIEILKKTNVDQDRLEEMQKLLNGAATKISESEAKLRELEFRAGQTDSVLDAGNDAAIDAANAEITKVIEAIQLCKATGDAKGLAENEARYEKLMAELC